MPTNEERMVHSESAMALIMAGPELLECLKDAAETVAYLWPDEFDDDEHERNFQANYDRWQAAISKAEGRSE